jgi:hypothetical protein
LGITARCLELAITSALAARCFLDLVIVRSAEGAKIVYAVRTSIAPAYHVIDVRCSTSAAGHCARVPVNLEAPRAQPAPCRASVVAVAHALPIVLPPVVFIDSRRWCTASPSREAQCNR